MRTLFPSTFLLSMALFMSACNSGSGSSTGSGSASSGPTFTTFDAPNIVVTAMNNDGVIVGYYSETVRPDHGFIRSADGTFTTFDFPNAAAGGTQINAINNLGEIAGSYADQSGNSFGFVRTSNNQVTRLTYVMFSKASPFALIIPTSLNDS
jgi:uncharacterized membrane protein